LDTIKRELQTKELQLLSAEKDLKITQNALDALNSKRTETELSIDRVLSQAREKAKEEVLKKCSIEQEKELSQVECELSALRKEKSAQLEHYAFDNIKKNVVSRSPLGDDTQALINELKQESYATVSKRFVDYYFTHLGKCRVSELDFLDALDKIKETKNSFFLQRDNKINIFIENTIDRCRGFTLDGDSQSSGTLIALGVLATVLFFIVFPFYVIGLGVTYYINLKKSYYLKKSLDLLKVVEDNFMFMEKALDVRAYDEYHKKQQKIEEEFGKAIALAQSDVDAIGDAISGIRQQAIANFKFDDSEIKARFEKDLQGVDFSIEEQKRSLKAVNARITSITNDIKKFRVDYDTARKDTIKEYINFDSTGKSKFFPQKFLTDDKEPLLFFLNGRNSNFFACHDAGTVTDFIKLICLQIRTRMLPNTAYVEIWDITTSGANFMALSNPNQNTPSKLFSIKNNSTDIKDDIEVLTAILQQRLQTILSQGIDIIKYNEDMVKLNSVTEPYYLILVLSPETVINDENFRRLLTNGPSLGIYVYIFADWTRVSEAYFPLLETSQFCSIVLKNKVVPQAKGALITQIKNKKKE